MFTGKGVWGTAPNQGKSGKRGRGPGVTENLLPLLCFEVRESLEGLEAQPKRLLLCPPAISPVPPQGKARFRTL